MKKRVGEDTDLKSFNERTLDDFAVARFNTDGSLDTTFGGDGKVTTDFFTARSDSLSDIAIDRSTGDIIAVGWTRGAGGSDDHNVGSETRSENLGQALCCSVLYGLLTPSGHPPSGNEPDAAVAAIGVGW